MANYRVLLMSQLTTSLIHIARMVGNQFDFFNSYDDSRRDWTEALRAKERLMSTISTSAASGLTRAIIERLERQKG